ncbi:SOS response-associated peptidase [Desulforamulus ferrireducens]|uniref:Abasic site processing protein n=1 Tax=Desulforamulus ferrireducens TaxID=1833852 RepID=A0A1S6IWX8_9FIRM|nr:SOS response-associated peptidase [Desulforamulus ferrireducens]AQS59271.1 hypothetical protein B0537_09350 [Desulforamulus ferrireducens]
MCGRFTITISLSDLVEIFGVDILKVDEHQPRYNVAPSQLIPVVTFEKGKRMAQWMKWGLIPSWAKDPGVGNKMINARAETLSEKLAYKSSFQQRRCLIPADSFFEWKKEGNKKQPLRFVLPNEKVFAFAGIWDRWISPQGIDIVSCSIITTEANEDVKAVHHRMPVILAEKEAQQLWLELDNLDKLKELLVPYKGEMISYPVSNLLNSTQYDSPNLIDRVPVAEQISFF